jgi:hypothetical protein
MLGTLISSVSNLASSYIEGKTAIQKAEATIRMKEATGEIDWDLAAMRASQSSWKDEWLTLLFSIPLVLRLGLLINSMMAILVLATFVAVIL